MPSMNYYPVTVVSMKILWMLVGEQDLIEQKGEKRLGEDHFLPQSAKPPGLIPKESTVSSGSNDRNETPLACQPVARLDKVLG